LPDFPEFYNEHGGAVIATTFDKYCYAQFDICPASGPEKGSAAMLTDRYGDIPPILPPSDDGVFQTVLTHPDAEPVLRDVLSSVLLLPIRKAIIRNIETPMQGVDEKRERFDVNAEAYVADTGERVGAVLQADDRVQAETEMQASKMEGDSAANDHGNIKNRSVFNLCDLHSTQKGSGIGYGDMMRSFQITFCGYTAFPNRADFSNRFSLRNAEGEELTDKVGIIFIELSKLDALTAKPVGEMTPLEQWALFYAYADKPGRRRLLEDLMRARREIEMANDILTGISQDDIQRAYFHSRRIARQDYEHDKAVLLKRGRVEGRVEGRIEGETNVARKMLLDGKDIVEIAKYTGLTESEVAALRST
jgi:predicted transposase/invertase (TIGR01784 family)